MEVIYQNPTNNGFYRFPLDWTKMEQQRQRLRLGSMRATKTELDTVGSTRPAEGGKQTEN